MQALDLDLAAAGYLRASDGRIRRIVELEVIARDLQRSGAVVFWQPLGAREAAYCYPRLRRIVLADWLWQAPGYFVRLVLAHELGHVVKGTDEETVERWQEQRYGELIAAG